MPILLCSVLAAAIIVDEIQIYVHDAVDKEAERKRLEKQKEFIEKGIKPLAGKLGNENFTSRAKPEVVEQSRQKLKELTDQLEAIESSSHASDGESSGSKKARTCAPFDPLPWLAKHLAFAFGGNMFFIFAIDINIYSISRCNPNLI